MANGGNVYFVPGEYTALGGLQSGLERFIGLRRQKELDEERKEDRKQDRAYAAFQTHLALGDLPGAARAAYLGGLTSSEPKPRMTREQFMTDLLQRGAENYGEFNDVEKLLFNVSHFGDLFPQLTRQQREAALKLDLANVDFTDAQTAQAEVANQLSQINLSERIQMRNALDEDVFTGDYESFKGSGLLGLDYLQNTREFKLRSELTASQIARNNALTKAAQAEAEQAGHGLDPATQQVVTGHAKNLLAIASTVGDTFVSGVDAVKYAVNPEDETISPAARISLNAAQELLAREGQSQALNALEANLSARNRELLDVVSAFADLNEDMAIEFLNKENADGQSIYQQLVTGIVSDMYGDEAVGTLIEDGWFWDKEITTFDLTDAKTFGENFFGTLFEARQEGDSTVPTDEQLRETLDQAIKDGADPARLYDEIAATDEGDAELNQRALEYLQDNYDAGPREPGEDAEESEEVVPAEQLQNLPLAVRGRVIRLREDADKLDQRAADLEARLSGMSLVRRTRAEGRVQLIRDLAARKRQEAASLINRGNP